MTAIEWMQLGLLVATVGAVIVAAIAAVVSVLVYLSQTDPDVVVYVATDPDQATLIYIAVHNIGKAVATDLTFRWDPAPPSKAYGLDPTGNNTITPFAATHALREGIPSLGPGERRLHVWGQWGGVTQSLEPHGDQLRVVCEYMGGRRALLGQNRRHRGDFVLEVRSLGDTPTRDSEANRAADALEDIAKTLQTIAGGAAQR